MVRQQKFGTYLGAISGTIATAVTYPIDLCRAHLSGRFQSDSHLIVIMRNIISKNGFFGLSVLTFLNKKSKNLKFCMKCRYAGLGVTIMGAVPYEGVRIGVYRYVFLFLLTYIV